ncbi:glycosyltransferase family 1 protein [Sabulilitoribacter multivorans]|uniref:Glycosyltransferase family 1 protein n=1 Tax=Flaviramulus multivorans TaxID=1304750 RepID=A0ABS9IJL7_9FLAO|nr:glycosyltransferase family 1 protein [Flaviramulus multivorans]MCF7560786.1 glycosyltransferase family 1 protein [Flaviramulus multivorans]
MAKIRVLQVFTIMNRGGAESMIMNYYRKIDRTKVQFDFLVHRQERAAFDDEIESLGGKIYRFNAINPLFPKKYYRNLRRFFKEHPEYSIIHSHLNTFSCFPLKIASEFNIPCRIAHAHIAIDKVNLSSFLNQKESPKEILKKLIKLQLKKRVKNDATHLFSCGKKAGNWLFGNTSFRTMNNAIDTTKFKYNEAVSAKYKKEFKLEDELVIGHIGRFVSQKNHSYLLKVFAELLKIKPHSSLVLIGDGPLRKNLEEEALALNIKNKTHFLGVRTDIPQLCQMMDVFVFPSFYEGLPVTLIEAQASSLKILASDTITNEVHLTNNIQFLSINDSPDFWASKIVELNVDKKVDQSKEIVEANYDIVSNTKNIQEFYMQQPNS